MAVSNPQEYMKFRLGTNSEDKAPEDKPKDTPPEGDPEKKPEDTPKSEDKGGEGKHEDTDLEAHSVLGSFCCGIIDKLLEKISPDSDRDLALNAASMVCAFLLTVLDILDKLGKDTADFRSKVESVRAKVKDFRENKIESLDFAEVSAELTAVFTGVEAILGDDISEDDCELIRAALKVTQEEAKSNGIETGIASYSKMQVYSKADVIKARLYMNELGWEKIGNEAYLIPGTDRFVRVFEDNATEDLMTDTAVEGGGTQTGVHQSFEDFKEFIDRIIKGRVGAFSDDDEYEDAIEIVQKRTEQGYSDDEVAEGLAEEDKPASEDKTCPECGKDPCECDKSNLETNSDFKTKLEEKLSK